MHVITRRRLHCENSNSELSLKPGKSLLPWRITLDSLRMDGGKSETMKTMDWQELATTSHYQTAVAIHDVLREGNVEDATIGLEELIDALARSEEHALKSYLIRLMQHIIKWRVQPERRSHSWVATIRECRKQIRELQGEHPRFTDTRIRERLWDTCYASGINEAEKDMNQAIAQPPPLTWGEVFEAPYTLEGSS